MGPDLAASAERALSEVLDAVAEHAPVVVVPSPPGAGKTGLVERVAAFAAVIAGETVGVATTTRAQAQELVVRLSTWESVHATWWAPRSRRTATASDIAVVSRPDEFPIDHGVVVATAAKWARAPRSMHFDLLVVDEAWQMPFGQFAPLISLADRFLLVGDPGQIAPVVQVNVSRWADDPAGPQRPAPDVLRARGVPGLVEVALPATRRLPADTARIVSDAFYPTMPFGSLAPDRTLRSASWPGQGSLAVTEVSDQQVGIYDPDLISQAAAIVVGVIEDGTIEDGVGVRKVKPADVGVVCSYVHQVPQMRSALGTSLRGVLVETANRWQGLERDVIVGVHPLSGQPAPSEFAMDGGRICVMCSRHKTACLLIGRPGLELAASAGSGAAERTFGDSAAAAGWQAHARLLEAVRR